MPASPNFVLQSYSLFMLAPAMPCIVNARHASVCALHMLLLLLLLVMSLCLFECAQFWCSSVACAGLLKTTLKSYINFVKIVKYCENGAARLSREKERESTRAHASSYITTAFECDLNPFAQNCVENDGGNREHFGAKERLVGCCCSCCVCLLLF